MLFRDTENLNGIRKAAHVPSDFATNQLQVGEQCREFTDIALAKLPNEFDSTFGIASEA